MTPELPEEAVGKDTEEQISGLLMLGWQKNEIREATDSSKGLPNKYDDRLLDPNYSNVRGTISLPPWAYERVREVMSTLHRSNMDSETINRYIEALIPLRAVGVDPEDAGDAVDIIRLVLRLYAEEEDKHDVAEILLGVLETAHESEHNLVDFIDRIQELEDRRDELEAQNKKLKQRNQALQNDLEDREQRLEQLEEDIGLQQEIAEATGADVQPADFDDRYQKQDDDGQGDGGISDLVDKS